MEAEGINMGKLDKRFEPQSFRRCSSTL